MDHEEIKNLIPLKALSRLDGDEARAVEEHLAAGCTDCERELASFNEALAAMALVESGEDGPADRVWSNLRARLDADRIKAGAPRRAEDRAMREPSRGRAFAIVASGAIAAAVAIVVNLLVINSRMQNTTNGTSNEIASLTAQFVDFQRKLDATGDQVADLQAKVAQTTDLTLASLGPDARIARLAGLAASPSATGVVALSHSQGTAILEVSGLPPTPDEKEYEVWWIGEKQGPLRAGMFMPATHGSTIVSLDLPPAGEVVVASAITLEPQEGVDKPTGAMYLKGDFPRR